MFCCALDREVLAAILPQRREDLPLLGVKGNGAFEYHFVARSDAVPFFFDGGIERAGFFCDEILNELIECPCKRIVGPRCERLQISS